MQGKKRYLALVLFLLLGLVTFSFANPDEQLEPVEGNVKKVSEQKDEKKVQTKFEKAEELVEQAEQNPTEEIIAEAEEAIEEAEQEEPELVLEEDLVNRLNNTEPAIDAAALISAVEKMIDEASKKDDVVAAKTYFDNNKVATVTDTLEDGTVKENLEERVAYLVKVFADTTNPVITGIENNQTTNIDVTLTIEDDIKVEKVVTLNGETTEYEDTFDKEGTYVVTVTDDAQNTTSITFTIDKTKPKFEGLSSREAHVDGYTVDITDATETTITVQKDHGDFAPITEGTAITEEGTYQLVAVDAAGNKYTTWVIVDRTEPKISGVTNGSYVNKCDRMYISDRYLNKVTINDETYTRSDFTHNTKNEDFKFEKRVCAEGTYTITATDKKGLTRTETFTIDKTAPVVTLTGKKKVLEPGHYTYTLQAVIEEEHAYTALLNGKEYVSGTDITARENYTLVVTDVAGNVTTIEFAIDKDKPKIEGVVDGGLYNYDIVPTITDKNLDKVTLNDKDYVVGTPITEDGEYTIVAKDKAGNKRTVTFTIDKTPATRISTDYYVHNLTQVGKIFYTQKGNKITVNVKVNEQLKQIPTFTLHNNGKDYVLTDVLDRGENAPGVWLYQASYIIDDSMSDGEVTFTISNIIDLAGNETADITTATNGRRIIVDNTAPKANYVAILQKGDNYQYATNGDTIRFLVQFNEEIVIPENKEDRTFILTINGKEVKFQRSQGTGYEYIAEYKIPKDEANLAEGELTFSISGYKDAAGNMGEPITAAKHHKYYKVTYDKTPIWYDLYQPGVRPVKVVDTVEQDGKLYIGEPAEVQFHDNYRIDSIQVNDGTPYVTPQGVSGQVKNITEPGEYTYTLIDGAGLVTKVTFVYVANTNYNVPNKDINLTEDVTLVNAPFYNIKENTQDIMINGNGHKVTQHVTSVDQFNWTENWTRTTMGNIFSNPAPYTTVPKITIKDIKFEGTTQSMLLGHYDKDYQGAKYFNTELNNVDMIGMNVVSLSANIAPTVYVYGNASLTDVNIYDSKLSPLDTDPMWPVYDLGLANYTKTVVNDSKIGSVITWTHSYVEFNNTEVDKIDTRAFHSHLKGETVIGEGTTVGKINVVPESDYDTKYGYSLTIKKGATVKVLDISKINNMSYIVIEEGAVVEKVVTASGEMTYEEWYNKNIDSADKLKKALSKSGELKITRDIIGNGETLLIPEGVEIVLDLSDKTITNKVSGAAAIENHGTLTIKGSGSIINGNDTLKASHTIRNYGTLTIESGNIGSSTTAGAAVINDGNTTINGGTFASKQENVKADGLCAYVFINNSGEMVINNANVNGKTHGLFASYNGTLTVKGGEYTLDGNNGLGCYVAYSNGKGKVILKAGTINSNTPRNNRYFYVYTPSANYFNEKATNTGWIVADEADIYLDGVKLPY